MEISGIWNLETGLTLWCNVILKKMIQHIRNKELFILHFAEIMINSFV